LAEAPGSGFGSKVSVGSGNDPNVDFARDVLADPLELAILKDSQKFGLVRDWNIADLIKK
jgi:hypothetical protein